MKQMRSLKRQGGWVTAALGIGGAVASLIGGKKGKKAAKQAADAQVQASNAAIAETKAAREQARADLSPYANAGRAQIDPLASLVDQQQDLATNSASQISYVKDNPFFKLLADDAQSRIFNNQAAKGKLGSGGTAEALQNSILLLGEDLINTSLNRTQQSINNRSNIVSMGQNAAAGQGAITTDAGNNVSNLITGRGDAVAAGKIGAANAVTGGINNLIGVGLGAYDMYLQNQEIKSRNNGVALG